MVRIGFSKTNHWLSRAIRFVTRSPVSHVFFIFFDPTLGDVFVLEAANTGMVVTPLALFKSKNEIVKVVFPEPPIPNTIKFLGTRLGTKYDYSGLLGSLWVQIGHWFKQRWHNPLASSKALFCSEAVVEALQSVDYPKTRGLDASATTPKDLYEIL